jgi:hypothetical protein
MIDPDDLLACPFCGGHSLENLNDTHGAVMCIDCGARGPLPGKLEGKTGAYLSNNLQAWSVRAALASLCLLLSGCGGQVASAQEDPAERFVAAVCACHIASGDTRDGCPANVRSEATGANPECLTTLAEAYEQTCSPNPFPSCE